MKKGINLRIYPNIKQQKLIISTFGATRFVYNHVLAMKKELWDEYRLSFTPKLKSFKEEWPFLTKVSSQAIANSYMDCLNAFNNFFNSLKKKTNQNIRYPKFHKKGRKDSFRIAATKTSNGYDLSIVNRNHIKIPQNRNRSVC